MSRPESVNLRRRSIARRPSKEQAELTSSCRDPTGAKRVMRPRTPQIIALGGGGFSMERDSSLLDDYVLSLTDAPRPRVCFLPTASGDADHYVVRFYRRFSPSCDASHVSLFRRDQGTGGVEDDLATHLLSQDLIYVGGGNVVSMLGAWRAHGLDEVLHKAWRKGIVLCGPSAGSLCWFQEALSAFHGAPRRGPPRPAPPPPPCCRPPPASTTAPSRRGAPSTTASSATACVRASPRR